MGTDLIPRATMNGKPVFSVPSKTIINFKSGFGKKLLCDDMTFSTGTACAYSCSFCYVPDAMRKQKPWLEDHGVQGEHMDVVIRRANALEILKKQIGNKTDEALRPKVIYASPLVDVAANMELVRETIDVVKTILQLTYWTVRLLSKSNLLPKIAQALESYKARVIYGVSTGTLDDKLAAAFEQGTPLVSKRIESLHWLQDNGYRTFGMICPSLPQAFICDYAYFSERMARAIRADKCEHVWAEVINVRGDSFRKTFSALNDAGYKTTANHLREVMDDKGEWEEYARRTFEAHVQFYKPGQLRFLQYVTKETRPWWEERREKGAVLL